MPLTRTVLDWTSRLGALLADRRVALIDVALPAENEEMASRIVVNWASMCGGSNAFVGIELTSEEAFCRSVAVGLSQVRSAVRQAAADGPDAGEPPHDATAAPPSVASTLDQVERVASWASPLVHTVVLAGRCGPDGPPAWLSPAVASTACSVKWLVLHDERTPLDLDDRLSRPAETAMTTTSLPDARRELDALCDRGSALRVLTCDGPAPELLPFLERERLAGLAGWQVIRATSRSFDARAVAVVGLGALGALDQTAGNPVAALGRVLDRRARATPTILVLGVDAPGQPCADLAELGASLSLHVLSPDARVILVGRGVSRRPVPSEVVAHPFRIDAACIERGIARRLDEGCPPSEACRFEAALASFAASRGEDEDALAHAERAVRIALDDPEPLPLLVPSLMTLGSVLSHAERLPDALEAFTRCAELASARGDEIVVGRAIGSIGHLYARVGSLDHAVRCYAVGAAVARSVGDAGGAAHAETWLADALRRNGEVELAAKRLQKIVELAPRAALPALDALFAPARGEASARLAVMLRDAGLEAPAAEADRAAAEAGHRGPLCSCPYP
jgi:tetratricopeptide (TPR) repeat protein